MIEQSIMRETIIQKVAGLPSEGLAAVMRFIESWELKARPSASEQILCAGEHPAFGLWADRTDIVDSLAYARELRAQAERRHRDPMCGSSCECSEELPDASDNHASFT
jgi:hypothetical protein